MPATLKPQIAAARQNALIHIKDCWQGSWSYNAKGEPSLEATAWNALAMRKDAEIVNKAIEFFEQSQNKDGGWSSAPGAGQSDWCTGPVVLSLRALSAEETTRPSADRLKKCIKRAFDHLLDSRTELYSLIGKSLMLVVEGSKSLEYPRGWPWTGGTFHWVEPTSYSLLALKIPAVPEQKEYKEIIAKANQFLTEHTCEAGGWNHGNNLCLGVNLPPYVVTTAEALLALQDLKEHEKIKQALAFLDGKHETEPTAMSLAWSILAKDAHGQECSNDLTQLVKLQKKDGSFGANMMVTGLAALSLEVAEGVNPLKF